MIPLAEIEAARERIAGTAMRTPLVRLHLQDAPAEIYLKLETLQPINSFKIRGAANAIMLADPAERAAGLVTASAGNMAQGVAWVARTLGLPATIAVPDSAPEAKLAAIERLGGRVLKLPYGDWWDTIITGHVDGIDGLFVHPVQDPAVIAGNGTIGLEILEDLPDPDAVVIPYGGGGLLTGIASAVKAERPGGGCAAGAVRPGPRSTHAPEGGYGQGASGALRRSTTCGGRRRPGGGGPESRPRRQRKGRTRCAIRPADVRRGGPARASDFFHPHPSCIRMRGRAAQG